MTNADLVPRRPITSLAVLLGMAAAVAASFAQQSQAAVTGKGYWQESQTESCTNAAICIVDFSAVPAAKQVTVTNVSCAVTVNGPALIREARLGSKNGSGTQQANFTYLTPTQNGVSGTFTYFSINNLGLHILRSGERANIQFTFNAAPVGEFIKCTISGIILG